MRWLSLFGGIGLLLLVVFMGDISKTADPAETSEKKTDAQNNAKTVSNKPDGLFEPEKVTLFVSGSRVNVRSGPGVSNSILGQLIIGDEVKLVSSSGNWRQIETKLGIGWMFAKYLATEVSVPKPPIVSQPRRRTIAAPSTREIQAARNELIQHSIRSYSGSCPCPYNTDRGGRRCGKRSAWSKPGGYSPICYDSDVGEARLNTYFARRRGAGN